jgi:hypothetical protein
LSQRAWWSAALLAALLGASSAPGRDLWRSGDSALEFSGSVRQILRAGDGTSADDFQAGIAENPIVCLRAASFAACPAFDVVGEKGVYTGLTRARVRFDLRWTPRLSATLVYDQELLLGTLSTLGDSLASAAEEDTFLGLEGHIDLFGFEEDGDHRRWRHRAYRAFVRFEDEHLELTVGRQRIPWGVGRLWNPIDRFNPIPPLAIEQDQVTGIDGVDLRWRFSGFTYLQGVYAPGTRAADARYALRFQTVMADADLSFMAGVFEEARTVGFDLARNLGDAAVRLEVVYTDPDREVWPVGDPAPRSLDSYWQIVVSADTNIDVGSGIYFLVEHLYNGNALGFGEGRAGPLLPFFESTLEPPGGSAVPVPGPYVQPASAAIFGGSRVVTSARHNTGLQMGYDLSAALRGNLLALYDWNGQSAVLAPSVSFTGLNAFEITLGVQVFAGRRLSQYGDRDPLLYAVAEFFF